MAMMIGDAGGISVGVEGTYGTAATTKVWQNAISATIGTRKQVINPGTLGTSYFTAREYGIGYCDGDIVVGYQRKRSVIAPILGALGTLTSQSYAFGTGTAPTNDIGSSVWIDTGGHLMQYTGCILTSLRWDLALNTSIRLTAGWLGQAGTKINPVTITVPTEADIQMESDLATFTLGGATICILGATIEVAAQVVGSDRRCLGGTAIKKPVRTGRYTVTASLQCELSSDTGNDTVAQLDDYLTGAAIGDLVIDDWTLTGCYMTGDPPSLQAGITTFPINVEAQYLTLVTEA